MRKSKVRKPVSSYRAKSPSGKKPLPSRGWRGNNSCVVREDPTQPRGLHCVELFAGAEKVFVRSEKAGVRESGRAARMMGRHGGQPSTFILRPFGAYLSDLSGRAVFGIAVGAGTEKTIRS
jgi:hypothetical protein